MWHISDLHFGHANVIKSCNRPFENLQEMHEVLIRNWNKYIKAQHPVFIHGDFGMKLKAEEYKKIVSRLNGQKFFIKGNHDPEARKLIFAGFHDVLENEFRLIGNDKSGKHRVLMSHFPYHPVQKYESNDGIVTANDVDFTKDRRYLHKRILDDGKHWLIHGHVHTAWKQKGRQINVGVDVWDFCPVHEEELVAMIDAGPQDIGVKYTNEMMSGES